MFARTLAGVVLLTVGGVASAQDMYFNKFSSTTDVMVNGVAVLDVSRNIGEVPLVAAVRRSAAITSGTLAFSAERRGSVGRCAPENCVSTQDELVDALSAIVAEGGVGVITLCRDEPLVLSERITLGGSIFKDVTIECCDVKRRRNSSSQPRCSIVTDTSPGSDCFTCAIEFEANSFESVELRGILFDGNAESTISLFGLVTYVFIEPMGPIMRRLSVVDCVFQNVRGVRNAVGPNLVDYQTRALNIFGGVESASGEESVSIEIVRSGFFDNESGGVLLLVLNVDDGSTGNVNANVRDCQFERNGNAFDFFRLNDYSGIAVIGNVASVVVESSRFIDNLSAALGAAIKIDSFFSGLPFDRRESVRLRENIFRGNRCGPGNEVASP